MVRRLLTQILDLWSLSVLNVSQIFGVRDAWVTTILCWVLSVPDALSMKDVLSVHDVMNAWAVTNIFDVMNVWDVMSELS